MEILIIAKTYNSNNSARAIQMTRVINALIEHCNYNITLITESDNKTNNPNDCLKVHYIKPSVLKILNKEKILGVRLNDIFLLRNRNFENEGFELAKKIIVDKNIQTVYTVSTPFDAHAIGLKLKSEFQNIKWVTFFSDIWPLSLSPKPYGENSFSAKVKIKMVREVIENCDGIITPSTYTLDIIKKNFCTNAKMAAIPHCLSPKNFNYEETIGGYIVHSGLLSKERIAEPLIEAVKELSAENNDFKGLVHIGPYHSLLKKIIDKHNCKNIFLFNNMPEGMANRIQCLYDVGVIIEAPMKEFSPFMPSKVTDIIQLNKKLITISPVKSFLSDFARENKGIFSCNYEKNNIKKCILDALYSTENITKKAIHHFHPSRVANLYDSFFKSI